MQVVHILYIQTGIQLSLVRPFSVLHPAVPNRVCISNILDFWKGSHKPGKHKAFFAENPFLELLLILYTAVQKSPGTCF